MFTKNMGLTAVALAFLAVTTRSSAQPKPLERIRVAIQDAIVEVDGKRRQLQMGDFLAVSEATGDQLKVTNLDRNWSGTVEAAATVKSTDAVAFFSQRIKRDPSDGKSFAVRGRLRDALGDRPQAKQDLDAAVELGSAEGHLYRGLYRIKQQQLDEALQDFGALVDSKKLLSRALLFRAQAHFALARQKNDASMLQKSLVDLNQALEFEDVRVAAYMARANIRAVTKDYAGAILDYGQAIKLGAEKAYVNRAATLMATGRFDEAVQDLGEAVRLVKEKNDTSKPNVKLQLAHLITTRARAYQANGDINAAYKDFDEAVSLAPDQPYVVRSRGFLHLAQQKLPQAIADLSAATKLAPKDAEAMLGLARSYELSQRLQESLDQYERASKLLPQDPRPLLGMASVRLSRDPAVSSATQAVELARKACELTNWKQAPAVKAALASLTAAGQVETALELFEQHQNVFSPEVREQIQGELEKLKK